MHGGTANSSGMHSRLSIENMCIMCSTIVIGPHTVDVPPWVSPSSRWIQKSIFLECTLRNPLGKCPIAFHGIQVYPLLAPEDAQSASTKCTGSLGFNGAKRCKKS